MKAEFMRYQLLIGRLIATVLMTFFILGVAHAQNRRVALVIGNGGYRNVDRLANPANDARLIASTLQAAGFTLVGGGPQLDLDKAHFDRAVQQFGAAVQGADVALFYYSGHGMQVQGANWLVPTDANPTGPRDLDFQMVDASLVLRQMEHAGTKLNLVILDACRNNPFASRGVRATAGGLAEMHAPEGTLISYATQPGNVAADGASGNSPYTAALVNAIRQPGVDVFRVFNQVGLTVKQGTGGSQQPWLASSPISGNFYFFNGPTTVVLPAVSMPTAPPAAAPQANNRFDGAWQALIACEKAEDGAAAWSRAFPANVSNGRFSGGWEARDRRDSSMSFEGPIASDGSMTLTVTGFTGPPDYSVRRVVQGTQVAFHIVGRFVGDHGEGQRIELRRCTLNVSRR